MMLPTTRTDFISDLGPGAISAITLSAVIGVIGTTVAIGVLFYVLRRVPARLSFGSQQPGIPPNSLQDPQGSGPGDNWTLYGNNDFGRTGTNYGYRY